MSEADRRAWLEREPRWARFGGIAAITGAALVIAAIVILQLGSGIEGDTESERLVDVNEHHSTLLVSEVVDGIGFALLSVPLLVLFRAALARSQQVRRALIAFAFIGPVLLAVSGVIRIVGLGDTADEFIERRDGSAQVALSELRERAKRDPEAIDRITLYPEEDALDVEPKQGSPYSIEYRPDLEDSLQSDFEEKDIEVDTDEDGTPGDALAEDLIDDSGTIQTGTALSVPGVLGLLIGLVYIPLWGMRTGLLTRFWATLGMALGVSLILLPFGPFAVVLWFIGIGFLLLGWWPGGRPAAWEAGVAVPWPKPGEEPPEEAGETVEGRGRELEEAGLPPDEPAPGAEPPSSGGPPPRKRKRRR